MCTNYAAVLRKVRLQVYNAHADADLVLPKGQHIFNHYKAPFIRLHPHADVGDEAVPEREVVIGEFGLLPRWSNERKIKYSTMNARAETIASASSYREPWARGQRCIVPMEWFVEPDWRSGKHVATKIWRVDGEPIGIAGLWDEWQDKGTGEVVHSFTLITINADGHGVMGQMHRPDDDKRMLVILKEGDYDRWLIGKPEEAKRMFLRYPAEKMQTASLNI